MINSNNACKFYNNLNKYKNEKKMSYDSSITYLFNFFLYQTNQELKFPRQIPQIFFYNMYNLQMLSYITTKLEIHNSNMYMKFRVSTQASSKENCN